MSEGMEISQRSAIGSQTTQIGVQNKNYIGMKPEEACKLAMNLFWENFPILQEEAREIANKRIDEFIAELMNEFERRRIRNFTPFADPGVQCDLVEAQKSYARYGTKEMLDTLTGLIAQRIEVDDDFALKITIDKAIAIAVMLKQEHLNFLSLLFICTRVKVCRIKTIEDLEVHLKELFATFVYDREQSPVPYLNMHGCLQISLPNPVKDLAAIYGFDVEAVKRICPKEIDDLHSDYGISPLGIILAIVNAQKKIGLRFDPHIWIHG